ncbi:ATP-binding protein [Aquirhabdus sp.]|uniref:ATP-binding protein n=1 Tax=Aquirhabdus sp. TaxID=2824160 RepID=UPI00396C74E7
MRIAITTKLFIAILGISALVIFAMGGAMTWSLRHSFNAFNEQQDDQRAQAMSVTLADLYDDKGSWDFIRNKPELWRDILRSDGIWRGLNNKQPMDPSFGDQLKGLVSESEKKTLQDIHNAAVAKAESKKSPVGGQHPAESKRPPPSSDYRSRRFAHWSLLDEKGVVIAGKTDLSQASHRYPILFQAKPVGWLAVSPRERRAMPAEQNFLAQQRKSSLLIMLGAAIVAIIAALLLARLFLAPVRRLADATQQLIAGRYETRTHVDQQDELGQLAKDFNHLAATLERNEKMRRDFVADISHELRTPLAILKGELEAIQDGIRKPDVAAMNSLLSETQALSQLVDDLYQLSLSDVGGLRYQMQEMDINASLHHVISLFQERFKLKQLTLYVLLPDQPVLLHGDERRLTQLFKNLFENTLRYTDPNGQVKFTMRRTDHGVHISLQDSAPGVSDEELPQLFERLYRVESSRNRATGGAGLGLPLCQTIVEAHGGTIQAKHSPLGGIWIDIVLPNENPALEGLCDE